MYAGYFFVFCFLHETYDADDRWIDKRKRQTVEEEENEQTTNEKNWLQPTHTQKKKGKERDRDEKERKVDIDKRIKI